MQQTGIPSCKRKPVVSFKASCLSYSLSLEKHTVATNKRILSAVFIWGNMLIIINAVSLAGGLLVEFATHWW